VSHTLSPGKSENVIIPLRPTSKSTGSTNSSAPNWKLPTLKMWRTWDRSRREELVSRLVTDLDLDVDIQPNTYWHELIDDLHVAAVEQKFMDLVEWLEVIQREILDRCSRATRVAQEYDDFISVSWVDCKTRSCNYCHGKWVNEKASRWSEAFQRRSEYVYLVICDETTTKASSVMDYATRLKHASLRIPVDGDGELVITTHPRQGATQILVSEVHELLLTHLAPLGRDDGRVTTNRFLRQVVQEVEEDDDDVDDPECRGDRDDLVPSRVLRQGAWRLAVAKGWAEHASGRNWRLHVPAVELAKFWKVNSGQPPQHSYRQAA
jgi:hypothetical protein